MLLVTFRVGAERFAIDAREVVEIVPLVPFRKIARAPKHVLGVFPYRGRVTPVLDLCALAGGKKVEPLLSTRVLIVDFPLGRGDVRQLGLAAERVTDAVSVDSNVIRDSTVEVEDARYLGPMLPSPDGLVQLVRVAELLPGEVQARLFPEESSHA